MASILDVLNAEQRKAVEQIDGPVMVFAGAGTGKTKTLTARIAYMVAEKDIKPYNILAITFTKKATNEMKERLQAILDDDAKQLNISTIHSLCVKILRRYIDEIGYARNFEIIDDEDVQKILGDIFKTLDVDKKAFSTKIAAKMIGDYKNGIGQLNSIINPIYEAYEAYLKKNNFLDFDDLLIKTEELFKKSNDVLEVYRRYFHYILVDEFQDTNAVQYNIIKMLAGGLENLFVVGDDDQSIYSFRGATIDNMLNFTKDFPNALVVKLQTNYRSHNSILKGANAVIRNNQIREPKQLHSDIPGSLNDVIIQEAYYHEAEVRYVINEIVHLVKHDGYNYSDIAVLYRNSAISRNFEMAFLEERIPYNIFGGFSYLKRKEIKDIISYFRFICDPNRITHFKRIINITSKGIGDKTIAKVVEYMETFDISLFDAIDKIYSENPSSKNTALVEFKDMIKDFIEVIETMPLIEFFDYLVEKTGYLAELEEEDFINNTTRVDNIKEFKSVLYNIDENINDVGLTQKDKVRIGIDDIMLDQSFDEDARSDAVTLSTIHSVKGLEFEVVFVVALEEGIFPSVRDDVEIEEERRVAYVAFTRAKSKIYLSFAQSRLIYGRVVKNRISRFLTEYLTAEDVQESVQQAKEKEETSSGELRVGAKVNHKYFGYGKVVAIDDMFVQIIFDKDQSIKKIKRDYPHIKVLE